MKAKGQLSNPLSLPYHAVQGNFVGMGGGRGRMKAKGQLSNPLPLPYHVIFSSGSSGFWTLSSSWLGV